MQNRSKALSSMALRAIESRSRFSNVEQDRAFVNASMFLGRKFDLRIYTLVTSFHPLKAWLAREGFARLSSELFDMDNIDDSRVHLTNMAIQLKIHGDEKKNHSKKGYKWALIKVREYLTARHGPKEVEILFQRIAGQYPKQLLEKKKN